MKNLQTHLVCLSLTLLLTLSAAIYGQSTDIQTQLEKPIPIAVADTQTFHLDIQGDQIAFFKFEQLSADIVIQVRDPEGKMLMEFDVIDVGPEWVQVVPNRDGAYQFRVFPYQDQKKDGTYQVTLEKIITKGPTLSAQLDQMISYWAEKGYLPGFATALVTKDEVLFQKAYGYASVPEKKPYTTETIQNIGSVSKTLIGISLMIAIEEGKLKLEDPVNKYLPYKVVNPNYPAVPITIKQLANHTSSIAEMDAYEKTYILKEPFTYKKGDISKYEYKTAKYYAKNKEMGMADFLEALLSSEGSLYKKNHYLKHAPGAKYEYSNAAATLAAHIIEIVYGMSYDDFTSERILKPLGMTDTGWSFDDIDMGKHADLHFFNQKVIPRYTLITYPDGGLLTNVKDLSTYLQAQMKGYFGEGKLISPESYQHMMEPSLSESQQVRKGRNYGVFWERRGPMVGHNGGDPGIVCLMRFNAEKEVGRIILTNVIPETRLANQQLNVVWGLLNDFGEGIRNERIK